MRGERTKRCHPAADSTSQERTPLLPPLLPPCSHSLLVLPKFHSGLPNLPPTYTRQQAWPRSGSTPLHVSLLLLESSRYTITPPISPLLRIRKRCFNILAICFQRRASRCSFLCFRISPAAPKSGVNPSSHARLTTPQHVAKTGQYLHLFVPYRLLPSDLSSQILTRYMTIGNRDLGLCPHAV